MDEFMSNTVDGKDISVVLKIKFLAKLLAFTEIVDKYHDFMTFKLKFVLNCRTYMAFGHNFHRLNTLL